MHTETALPQDQILDNESRNAIDALQSEIARDPRNMNARCDLGLALLRMERFDEAVACYKAVLRIDPQHPEAHIGLGHVLIAIGNAIKLSERLSRFEQQQTTGIPAEQNNPRTTYTEPTETLINQLDSTPSAELNQPPIQTLKPNMNGTTSFDGSDGQPAASKMTMPLHSKEALSTDDVLDHMVDSIERAEIGSSPFTYINFAKLFPQSFYDQILEHLPETSSYEELRHKDAILPNGKSARLMFELSPDSIQKLPNKQREFWMNYHSIFYSVPLARAILTKLNFSAKIIPWPILLRDYPGYKILPHSDIAEKAVTVMFYLPPDESQVHLGTSLYVQNGKDDFTRVNQVPFLPNSGFSFEVTEDSWHGVEQTSESDGIRDSLGIVYFHSDKQKSAY